MKNLSLRLSAIAVATALSSHAVADDAADDTSINSSTNIETIVISGNKTEQTLADVAGSISVMTSDDMQKQVVTDMKDLFKYEPGVSVTGGAGEAQNIVVRGMSGDRVLMIKDGMRMNEGYGANGQNDVVGRGFVETDILKQVEVSKSAASSLYGSDAIGGVVVFTTKDPSDLLQGEDTALSLRAGYAGASSQSFVGITAAQSLGEYEHMISGTFRDGNETENYNDDGTPTDVESYDIFYKGVYSLSSQDKLKFTADIWNQEASNPYAFYADNFRTLPGYYVSNESTSSDQENTSFKLSYHSERNSGWYDILNVGVYRNEAVQDDVEYFDVETKDSPYAADSLRNIWQYSSFEQTTIGLISNAIKQIDNHSIGFGLDVETTNSLRTVHEYRLRDGEIDRDIHSIKFPENDTLRVGIFVNDAIELGKLTVTPGVRFDHYDMDPENSTEEGAQQFEAIDESQLSPSLGAVYKFNERLAGFAQYARGFKVPPYDLAYIDHDNTMAGYKVVAAEHLDPETSDSFELGLRGHIGNFAFTTSVFHNKYDDFINIALIGTEDGMFGPVQIFQYQNIDSVTIEGAEFGVTYYAADNWSLYANASYMDGENDDTNEYVSTITPISGTAGVAYDADNWGVDSALRFAKSMTKVNEGDYQTPGFGAVDVMAYYNLAEQLSVNLRVENLFDKEYVQHLSVSGSHADIEPSSFTEAGRNFSVSVRYQF